MLGAKFVHRQTTDPRVARRMPLSSPAHDNVLEKVVARDCPRRRGAVTLRERGWGAFTMSQPYVGQIMIFGGNFAPAGWMVCAGQLLPISENETLFQLIGTTYGGDGQSTFGLPDLRGRLPMHQGGGFVLAETGGAEEVTITVNTMPAHSHPLIANSRQATSTYPTNRYLSKPD